MTRTLLDVSPHVKNVVCISSPHSYSLAAMRTMDEGSVPADVGPGVVKLN